MRRASPLVALLLAAVLPFALAGPANAKIYKWVMPDGSIQYSDRPQEEGAKEAELPPLQLYTAPPPPAEDPQSEDDDVAAPAEAVDYTTVEFVSPKAGEVIRDNGGTVNVQLKLEPALQSGHTVEISLDGKPVGSGKGTSASLTNVDRGSHTVSAVVKNADGATVASAPGVSFELKRASRLLPARPANTGG